MAGRTKHSESPRSYNQEWENIETHTQVEEHPETFASEHIHSHDDIITEKPLISNWFRIIGSDETLRCRRTCRTQSTEHVPHPLSIPTGRTEHQGADRRESVFTLNRLFDRLSMILIIYYIRSDGMWPSFSLHIHMQALSSTKSCLTLFCHMCGCASLYVSARTNDRPSSMRRRKLVFRVTIIVIYGVCRYQIDHSVFDLFGCAMWYVGCGLQTQFWVLCAQGRFSCSTGH